MAIRRYLKREIALNQLETALALFFMARDLFSVITLAAAAEEILGELLKLRSGARGPFRPLLDMLRPGKREREEKQSLPAAETERELHIDAYREAVFLLGRAIDDYRELGGRPSPAMERFDRELRGKSGSGSAT